ncbi:MAG: hypothetical protein DKT66_09715 [Candidatus Melainabacteria bacterium]|nr:MAG: hypothetical protein DKT66_09715 [Candidatus Melainabacteria bacterium]
MVWTAGVAAKKNCATCPLEKRRSAQRTVGTVAETAGQRPTPRLMPLRKPDALAAYRQTA